MSMWRIEEITAHWHWLRILDNLTSLGNFITKLGKASWFNDQNFNRNPWRILLSPAFNSNKNSWIILMSSRLLTILAKGDCGILSEFFKNKIRIPIVKKQMVAQFWNPSYCLSLFSNPTQAVCFSSWKKSNAIW